jgi:hypothetical protein
VKIIGRYNVAAVDADRSRPDENPRRGGTMAIVKR